MYFHNHVFSICMHSLFLIKRIVVGRIKNYFHTECMHIPDEVNDFNIHIFPSGFA